MPGSLVMLLCLVAVAVGSSPARADVADRAPSRADVAARAKALGFGRQAAAIARDALAGARLAAGGRDALGATRLGGRPDLPSGTAWPSCHGRRLSFLAQLRPADLAKIALGTVASDARLLLVFADLSEDRDGITRVEEAYGRVGEASCVVVRVAGGPLVRRTTPRGLATLRSRPVRLRPTLTVPDYFLAQRRYKLADSDEVFDAWSDLQSEAAAGTLGHTPRFAPTHQVLGWPSPVQETPLYGCGRSPSSAPSYRLLLQLDFDEPLRFAVGDGGVLYLTGRPADLRAGRFERLCAEFQEG